MRLGRCLETLYPCDSVIVVDHGSTDATVGVAREYGARVVAAGTHGSADSYVQPSRAAWILCLDPRESLTESLAASLFEWKLESRPDWKQFFQLHRRAEPAPVFALLVREETPEGWTAIPTPETRLVPPTWNRWVGRFPAIEPSSVSLEGELLRFAFP
ncbi:MAG TPA: hypothetical protein VMG31_09090 [Verrucomicrobiae bacterium]|nr:hypothetical protein [Verrucomicrobiae bacterium]